MKLSLSIECDCREKPIKIPIEKDLEGEYCFSKSIDDSQGYFQSILTNPHNMYIRCACGKQIAVAY